MVNIGRMRRRRKCGRPWSELPGDILTLVMKRLQIADRVRLQIVCKGWRLPGTDDGMPWTMEYKWKSPKPNCRSIICELYEPFDGTRLRKPSFSVDDGGWIERTFHLKGTSGSIYGYACASKYSWVLFCKPHTSYIPHGKGGFFFFFNVFTKEMISLPYLETPTVFGPATFSSPPTSPDCILLVSHKWNDKNELPISTYSFRDQTWKTHAFNSSDNACLPLEAVLYMDGSFYFSFNSSKNVGIFNIANQESTVLEISFELCWDYTHIDIFLTQFHLVDCDGELLLIYLFSEFPNYGKRIIHVYKMDWSRNKWISQSSLEGGAIFVDEKTSKWVPAKAETENIANRIYYVFDNQVMYQNYDDSPVKDVAYCNTKQSMRIMWIQPSQDQF